ncbi:MAG: two component transcriptional regulator, LytTR family [Gemmatimonadetes bacterium]|nr:two component transcriptional regulator, LytTR family [Gemmatimonadota bacterium]
MPEIPGSNRFRVLIVDDEPAARRGARLVVESRPDFQVVGECTNGSEAIVAIRALGADVVLLDIQMPGQNGFDVIRALGADHMPDVVFVTAHDSHAVKAFEVAAVDYIVKPYTDARLLDALDRARARQDGRRAELLRQQLRQLLQVESAGGSPEIPPPSRQYLSRFLVTVGSQRLVVEVADVTCIRADDYCVTIFAGGSAYVMRESLTRLEERLDPHLFLRVHRSALVRTASILKLDALPGNLSVVLRDGTRVPVSRSRRDAILSLLGDLRG